MSYGPAASREYLRNSVLTASPEQLQLMLLDGAIRHTTFGKEAIERKDLEQMFNGLERAQRIVLELSNGLQRDVNPELVDRMAALYAFIYRRLVDASMDRDANAADEALRILRHQRETWVLVMQRIAETSQTPPTAAREHADTAQPSTGFVAEG